jgi:hypothetical protein
MWLNDGTGTFTNGSMQFAGGGENNEMVVGDVDGDGDPDTIYDNEPFGLVLELNDGAGVFTYVFSQIPTQANSFIEFIQMGDIDGDSDLDVVFGRDDYASTAEEVVLWKNDGAGTFTEVAAGLPQQLHDYRLGDIDDDGDLDLVSVDSILLNDGAGSFTPDPDPSPFSVSDPANDLALLDLDLDGDLDAVFTRYGVDRIYTNLTRQLSWRALPRLGQTLTLDIYGPQDGVRVLLASTARLSSPIGTAEGFVQVDPASLFLIKFGMLDGNGESSFVRTVPVDPTLAGVTVWWQAYVAGPARPAMLTNLESTLLSTF